MHFQLFLCMCPSCQWRVDLRCAEVRTTAPLTHSNYSLTGSGGSPKQADSTLYKVIHWLLFISIIFKQQHYRKLRGNWNKKYLYMICTKTERHTYIDFSSFLYLKLIFYSLFKLGVFPFSVIMDLLPFGSLPSCSLTLRPWKLLNQKFEACRTLLYSIPPSTGWSQTAHLYLVHKEV